MLEINTQNIEYLLLTYNGNMFWDYKIFKIVFVLSVNFAIYHVIDLFSP